MAKTMRRRSPKKKSGKKKSCGGSAMNSAELKEPMDAVMDDMEESVGSNLQGGKKGKTSKKGGKKKGKKGKKSKKMNEFFKLLIDAKKNDKPSFTYKGKTYKKKVGTSKNPKLIIYKKA